MANVVFFVGCPKSESAAAEIDFGSKQQPRPLCGQVNHRAILIFIYLIFSLKQSGRLEGGVLNFVAKNYSLQNEL